MTIRIRCTLSDSCSSADMDLPLTPQDGQTGSPQPSRVTRMGAVASSWFCSGSTLDQMSAERATHFEIWLQRSGWHEVVMAECRALVDPLSAVFYNADDAYEVRSRAGVRQTATQIVVERDLLESALETSGAESDRFPRRMMTVGSGIALEHFRLVRLLSAECQSTPIEVEETVLGIIRRLLEEAAPSRGAEAGAKQRSRREIITAVRELLASRYGDDLRLSDISDALGVSPFHLSRLFSQGEGQPIHRYLMKVRLRAALDRLHDPSDGLTEIALDSGFSSHSHFTTSFRREFGITPSELRR